MHNKSKNKLRLGIPIPILSYPGLTWDKAEVNSFKKIEMVGQKEEKLLYIAQKTTDY